MDLELDILDKGLTSILSAKLMQTQKLRLSSGIMGYDNHKNSIYICQNFELNLM